MRTRGDREPQSSLEGTRRPRGMWRQQRRTQRTASEPGNGGGQEKGVSSAASCPCREPRSVKANMLVLRRRGRRTGQASVLARRSWGRRLAPFFRRTWAIRSKGLKSVPRNPSSKTATPQTSRAAWRALPQPTTVPGPALQAALCVWSWI